MQLSGPEENGKAVTVAVVGASGKTGRHLVARLATDGMRVIAVGRSPARLVQFSHPRAERRIASFEEPIALRAALEGAEVVVNTAEARFVDALLAAPPAAGSFKWGPCGDSWRSRMSPDAMPHTRKNPWPVAAYRR